MKKIHPIEERLLNALSRTQICPKESLEHLTCVYSTAISSIRSFSPRVSLSLANIGANPDVNISDDEYERIFDISGLTDEEIDLIKDNILRKTFGQIYIHKKILDFLNELGECSSLKQMISVLNKYKALANPINQYGKVLSRDGNFSKLGRELIQPGLTNMDDIGDHIIRLFSNKENIQAITAESVRNACERYKAAFLFALT